jgi:hypothetical protein
MFYKIFVKEIRMCFIGLSKPVTKDNSLMFYRILVNFRNFGEICDCLLEFKWLSSFVNACVMIVFICEYLSLII